MTFFLFMISVVRKTTSLLLVSFSELLNFCLSLLLTLAHLVVFSLPPKASLYNSFLQLISHQSVHWKTVYLLVHTLPIESFL